MSQFELHIDLSRKEKVVDLPLCSVLLQDEKNYPWLILVPRREKLFTLLDLHEKDHEQFLKELFLAQKILWKHFSPNQVNVAAIGNKTPQLHVHVIARFSTDPAWPGTVWDHPQRLNYTPTELKEAVESLRQQFNEAL